MLSELRVSNKHRVSLIGSVVPVLRSGNVFWRVRDLEHRIVSLATTPWYLLCLRVEPYVIAGFRNVQKPRQRLYLLLYMLRTYVA